MRIEWEGTDVGIGTLHEAVREGDGWMITTPRGGKGEQPTVELRYGRDVKGDGFPVMMEIGRFASAAEAMLAAMMYDDAVPCERVDAHLLDLGFQPYYPSAFRLEIKDGRRSAGRFIFATTAGGGPENDLGYEGRGLKQGHSVARTWGDRMQERFRPAADMRGVERAVLLELLKRRLAKGPGRYAEPMTMEELAAWADARYGRPVDPYAGRPHRTADRATVRQAARELMLGDTGIAERLGVAPGLADRIPDHDSHDWLGFLARLMAFRPPEVHREILDALDAKVLEVAAPSGPRGP